MRLSLLLCLVTLLSLEQTSSSRAQANEEDFEVKGRIVLFDWRRHGLEDTFEEDFVVRISASKEQLPRYVRVIHPGVASLAPEEVKRKYRLEQHLFIGRGDLWTFRLRRPQKGTLDQDFCNRSHEPIDVKDELGSVQLPAYFPTPGSLGEKVPALASLPCFILTERPTGQKASARGFNFSDSDLQPQYRGTRTGRNDDNNRKVNHRKALLGSPGRNSHSVGRDLAFRPKKSSGSSYLLFG